MTKDKKTLGMFLVLAFFIPLVCILLMRYCSIFGTGFWNLLLYGIEAASPSIAAIIVCIGSACGVRGFLREKYIQNISVRYCVLGALIPAVVIVMAKAMFVFGLHQGSVFTGITVKKTVIILWALVAEELGWRGFLQGRLEKYCKEIWVPIIIGCIWALWHYHFILSGTMDIPYLAFAYGCIAESFGYYLITKLAKGNVIPASIWHFSGNLFFNICRINPEWNGGSFLPYHLVNGMNTIYIIIFIVYFYHEKEKKIEE